MTSNKTIDKADILCRFRRSVDSYDENAIVQKSIVDKLCKLLHEYVRPYPERILEIGCGTGLLTSALMKNFPVKELFINDLVQEMCCKTADRCTIPESRCIVGDIETLTLSGQYGMIVSSSTFQWFSHPADTLKKLSEHLREGGFLVFSTFGQDNLKELRQVSGQGLVYLSAAEWREILSSHFDILYLEEEAHTLYFNSPVDILRHIKNTGVNATAAPQLRTKGQVDRFSRKYSSMWGTNGQGCPLTYHPVYWICRKKDHNFPR